MARPFARILQPSDPWFQEPGSHEALANNFKGKSDEGISVCDITTCSPDAALAAFYGHRGGMFPLRPAWLSFTDDEVQAAGGTLTPCPTDPPWPQEYSDAHHDVVGDLQAVSAAMADLFLAESGRRRVVDRALLIRLIVDLAQRPDAPAEFVKNTHKRVKRLQKEEPEFFEQLADQLPVVRTMLAKTK